MRPVLVLGLVFFVLAQMHGQEKPGKLATKESK